MIEIKIDVMSLTVVVIVCFVQILPLLFINGKMPILGYLWIVAVSVFGTRFYDFLSTKRDDK